MPPTFPDPLPPSDLSLDVTIRFHDPARLDELGRAVFSAALSDHQPLAIQVACQRFDLPALQAVHDTLAPILEIAGDIPLQVLNRPDPTPIDARAALLNLGLRAGQGRYAAFLDYDDLIYPEAYRLLVAELEATSAAVAFGGILNAYVSRDGLVPITTAKRRVFQGEGLARLLYDNFCPLHSFVVDRHRIAPQDLVVDETLCTLEDYDLLLRLVAKYPSSFRLKDKIVGEYLFKDDDSNINPLARAGRPKIAPTAEWAAAEADLTHRKATLLLSPVVQSALGLDEPGLTVAAFLARQPTLGY